MDMSSELIGIISVGVAAVVMGLAILTLGWRVTNAMREENQAAHDDIGNNIASAETRLNDRMGRMEGRIDTRIDRLEERIDTRMDRLEETLRESHAEAHKHLREDNAETRKRIDRLFDQRASAR